MTIKKSPLSSATLNYKRGRSESAKYGKYSETWELGTPKGLSETVLNSDVVLFSGPFLCNEET